MPTPRYTEQEARIAITASRTFTEALRRLGMRPAGSNHATLKRYAHVVWKINTDHFDHRAVLRESRARGSVPLDEVLVEHSIYQRGRLKERLYASGLKQPNCELCGQGEIWKGRRMSLILDHISGCATDNRLENLRIVCPNCAATLPTHCGRMLRRLRTERLCETCNQLFSPRSDEQRFCDHKCWAESARGVPQRQSRRAKRPPYEQLIEEVESLGYRAVGRRYGVSDNAVRKWIRQYARELQIDERSRA